jgi:hypothetical protein
VDSWYKNESLRNTRLVAAQSAAVQDRQMAQPMMFGAGTPYGTVVLPSALVGSAFSGQWGPAYEDSGAWGQPPNVQEAFKNAGGGVQNQWPQILQPQTAPTIQGQQPTGQPRPTPQLTAASAIGASDVTAAPNSPTPSQPVGNLDVDFPPGSLPTPAQPVGNLDVDFPPGSLPTPASDPYAADAAMNPASPGGQPAGGQGGPRTFTAPPLVSGSISGGFPYGAMYPPGTDRSRQFTAPPLVSGSISGGFPRGYMYPSQQGGTAGGAAAGGAGKTPVTSTVQQHDDGQWWKDTQWSDDSWTYEPASDPYSADVGYNAAAPTPPAATPTASPTGSNSISGAYPRGYMYPGGSQGGGWPSMPWSWDDIGNAAGNLFGGRSSVPNDGRNVMERVAHPQGEQWDDTRRTWVRPDGTYWDPNSGTWHGPAGGGEWDFGSGQGDPMEDLAALGAGPQLGQPPVPPPGGSMSPVPPEAVVGQGNQFGEPVSNETPYHKGVDYQAAEGTPAQAPVTGTVVYVGERGDLGLSVVIQDEAGQSHELNHLADANVQVGDPVQAGQPVGQVGSTGASTGAHLDYRVRGQNGDFTDPNALPGVGDVLGGMPDMEGMPQDELNPGSGQGEGWGYGPPRAPSNPWALSAPDDQYPTNMTGWANTPIGAGGGDPWAFGSGQGEGEEVVYYADGGRVIRKTTWGGDESSAVYEDTGMATQAPDGTASQSAEGLAGQGTAAQPTAPAATSTAAAATPTANASSSSRVYQTKNGARTEAQMEQELRNAGWPGGESVVDAYARTTGGNVSTAPGTTNPAAAQRARGPFTTQSQNGWEFVYDADGNLVSYQPRYNPAQADTEGGWNLKLQESAQAAAAELAKQRAQAERDVAGITGRSNVLATWGRTAAGSPWISRLTGRSPAPGDLGSPEASGGFGWPPPQSQQSAQLLQNITGPAQSPTSGSWQDAVPGATSGAYSQKALGWEDLVGSGAGDWSDYANVDQQYEGMESGWPSPPSADEFTNLGPFGQSAMRYGMESAGVPWRPWADAMLGAWRQTNQQAPTGLSGWAPRNVSRLGYDVASPTTKAQYSNEAELFRPVSDWLEKEQRRWQPTEARTAYAA